MAKTINFKNFGQIIWNLLLFSLSLPHLSLSADVNRSLREKKLLNTYNYEDKFPPLSHSVIIQFCPLAKAQRPGGVASPEVWFRTVPATSNLQGYYLWKDFSGDSVRNLLYDSRGAAYGTEFRQQRDNITTFNFHPALDLSERTVPKEALLRYSNLSQATVIGIFD